MKGTLIAGTEGSLSLYKQVSLEGESSSHLYLYGEVGWSVTLRSVVAALEDIAVTDPLTVHIHSGGGEVFEGFAIFNIISARPDTTAIVEGLAGSMASVIMCACNRVEAYTASTIMIHQPRTSIYGTAADLRKQADLVDQISQKAIDVYVKRTGMKEKSIRSSMDSETYYNAKEALEAGFVDEIIGEPEKEVKKSMTDSVETDGTVKGQSEQSEKETTPRVELKTETPAVDTGGGQTDLVAANKERVQGIRSIFSQHAGHDDLMFECIADTTITLDSAKVQLLDAISAGTLDTAKDLTKKAPRVETKANWVEPFVGGASEAILGRIGIEIEESKFADARDRFKSMTLLEMARYSLESKGIKPYGDRMAIVGAAFQHGTGDFVKILEDSARKAMLKGYKERTSYHGRLARTVSVQDFKEEKLLQLGAFSELEKVDEQGEYKFGTVGEYDERISIATYGKQFGISRQAIINDDMNAFTTIPRKMGQAVPRMYGDMVARLLTQGNGAVLNRDGEAIFAASRNNTSNAVPSTDSLDKAAVAMRTQKGEGGVTVEVIPSIIYCPVGMERKVKTVLASQSYVGDSLEESDARVPNVVPSIPNVIADSRLDEASPTRWYMLANPNQYDTLAIAFLDGQEEPFMESYEIAGRDGLFYRVRADAGVAALDYKGLYRGGA